MLYSAAAAESVLHIKGGVGLLDNYGLWATILNNTVLLGLARLYHDEVRSILESKAVTDPAPLARPLAALAAMLSIERRYRFSMYLLVIIGFAYWLSNLGFHVLGHGEVHWGHKVFDSPDHPWTFVASRLHNLVSWVIVLPLVAHVMICVSIQLRRLFGAAVKVGGLQYDLLNPDRKGGFVFVDRAHLAFNTVAALVYIQITFHIETFDKIGIEYVLGYITLTVLLLGINRVFLGDIYGAIKDLRIAALNKIKDKVYQDDQLSFDILKYCYEQRINAFSVFNVAVRLGAVLLAGATKLLPIILPRIYPSLR